jgi:acyl-CoA reductase-like NAD-dependent aldehyde dehydrogenase
MEQVEDAVAKGATVVHRVPDDEAAIALANDSRFGLGG